MNVAKRYCKLIFSTFAMALCFIAFSITAWADPLAGAMIGAGLAGGFGFGGMVGMTAPGVSGTLTIPGGYSDPLDWDDGQYSVRIRSHSGDQTKVDVELSSGLARTGNRRLEQFNSYYGLTPGTLHSFGNRFAYRNYDFTEARTLLNNNVLLGPTVGTINFDSDDPTITVSVYSDLFTVGTFQSSSQTQAYYRWALHLGNRVGNENLNLSSKNTNYNIRFGYSPDTNEIYCYRFNQDGTISYTGQLCYISNVSSTVTLDRFSPTVSRDQDSEIIDPLGQANVVTLPSSYMQGIPYNEDEPINIEELVKRILDKIIEASTVGDIDDSWYLPAPGPTPVPGETIADTPYSELEGDLGDISDTIGTGNSLLDDIKDLLGNATDGIKGTVEDISDALTNTVDGIKVGVNTIISILQGIATHVAELVQEIVNAEYNWVNGFISNFFGGFTDWFSTLRQHVSIWHYVVEWLSDISTCFAFFWGALAATGNSFILPVYAAFAGTVVIAIYRRFGR